MVSYKVEEKNIPICVECGKPDRAPGRVICHTCDRKYKRFFKLSDELVQEKPRRRLSVDDFAKAHGGFLRLMDFPATLKPYVRSRLNQKSGGLVQVKTEGRFRYIHADVYSTIAKSSK